MLLVASGARGTLMLVSTIAAWIGFMAVIFYQTLVVQPRAMRRRHALEARLDPAAAARRRRRERIHCWIARTVGLVFGCAGVVLGLHAAVLFLLGGVGGVRSDEHTSGIHSLMRH